MFYNAAVFNQDMNAWNTSAVKGMSYMFYGAKSFNKPIGSWKVSGVKSRHAMFFGATSFNQELGVWDTSAVTEMGFIFAGAKKFSKLLSTWNFSTALNTTSSFDGSGVTGCVKSRTTQALGWRDFTFQDFVFDLELCPACPCGDTSLACVNDRCSPVNSGFIDLGRDKWLLDGAFATAEGFRACVEKCQASEDCSSFVLRDSGQCFLQRTAQMPRKPQDPDTAESLAFLKPSCRTFSCGPGATPKPLGSLSTAAVTEAACCSCLDPSTVPEPGHRSRGDLLCVSCPAGTEPRHESCQTCPAGRYAKAGSETCQPCSPGLVPTNNSSECQRCPPGTYSDLSQCAVCVFPLYLEDNTCILPDFVLFCFFQTCTFLHLLISRILKPICFGGAGEAPNIRTALPYFSKVFSC